MITYKKGTVFNTPAKTIVNSVNIVGVMGAGIALEFKLRYPEMYKNYKKLLNFFVFLQENFGRERSM